MTDSSFEAVSRPEEKPAEQPEKPQVTQPEEIDPFDGLESIFDLLDQSESDMSQPINSVFSDETVWQESTQKQEAPEKKPEPAASSRRKTEHSPKKAASGKRRASEESTPQEKQDVPDGIWTDDRHLFPQEKSDPASSTHEELNMLKEKKRGRSSKTQRLFDAIMREPDDNPNFRKK